MATDTPKKEDVLGEAEAIFGKSSELSSEEKKKQREFEEVALLKWTKDLLDMEPEAAVPTFKRLYREGKEAGASLTEQRSPMAVGHGRMSLDSLADTAEEKLTELTKAGENPLLDPEPKRVNIADKALWTKINNVAQATKRTQ
ncbi:MAG TPA: hypothetical protein VLE91_02170 [Candidatus Saccharimonadales bacterium]|nr:hypothetical protein [Candidatus Saccharimonadales bacterium]